MPKVSVIIPVYNVEKYMSQCINSVLNQTYRDFEIILVDDGSTDKSPEICDEYTLKDKRVKTIHQKNKGLGGARNTGLDIAMGEYILFIDSDDWVESDALEVMIDKIEKTGADFVIAGITLYIDDTKEYRSGWIKDFSDRTGVYEITSINFIETFTPAWARLYRKSFIDKNYLRFVENCYYEDNSWGCLVACFANKIAFVKKLFYYRQHKNQITAKKDKKVFDWVRDFKFFYNFIKTKNINPEKLEMAKMWYLLNFYHYYNQLSLKNKKIFRDKICEILPLLDMDTKLIETTKVISSKNERSQLIYFFKFLNSKFLYKYYYSYKNCIKEIFSIRNSNDRAHKLITIFGIKIKIKKKFDYLKNLNVNKESKSIPKIIHYCWFGGNPKTKLVKKCIASWKKYLPDYQIREWNDHDLKECSIQYVKEAYKAKKWAFITDYFRLYALYNYGGIYFDSDNEVFKSFDDLLHLKFFSGYENWNNIISPFTAVVAARKGNHIVKDLLDEYDNLHFLNPDGSLNMYTNTARVTDYFREYYSFTEPYDENETRILEEGCVIYPSNIFCKYEENVSYAVHHFSGSWLDKSKQNTNILQNIFSIKNEYSNSIKRKVITIVGLKIKVKR